MGYLLAASVTNWVSDHRWLALIIN